MINATGQRATRQRHHKQEKKQANFACYKGKKTFWLPLDWHRPLKSDTCGKVEPIAFFSHLFKNL